MKRILLSALFAIPFIAMSQTTILTENFDAYADGDWAGEQSAWMSTWSGVVGAASTDDVPVTNTESFSASNSIMITGPQAGGTQDAVVAFPVNYTAGSYEYTMKYKVAAGMGGYMNIQAFNSGFPGEWIAEIMLAADGTGTMDAGGQTAITFNYTNGAWIDVLIQCNLDTDEGHVFIDGFEVGSGFQWSLTTSGTASTFSFGSINLYSASGDPVAGCEYYVDDIMLVNTTGVGLEETPLVSSMNVVPNPSNGNFKLNYTDMSMENAKVTLVDVLGKTIYSKDMSLVGNATLDFDLNLRNGVYFVSVSNAETKMTKKIIVKK